jgi:hypothetical protein
MVAQARGHPEQAFELARPLVDIEEVAARRYAYTEACQAAWRRGADSDLAELIAHVDGLAPADVVPSIRAHADRFAGLLASRRGEARAGVELLRQAGARLRELGYSFELGEIQLEIGEILLAEDGAAEADAALAEAAAIFADLRAEPWLERIARARRAAAPEASALRRG